MSLPVHPAGSTCSGTCSQHLQQGNLAWVARQYFPQRPMCQMQGMSTPRAAAPRALSYCRLMLQQRPSVARPFQHVQLFEQRHPLNPGKMDLQYQASMRPGLIRSIPAHVAGHSCLLASCPSCVCIISWTTNGQPVWPEWSHAMLSWSSSTALLRWIMCSCKAHVCCECRTLCQAG